MTRISPFEMVVTHHPYRSSIVHGEEFMFVLYRVHDLDSRFESPFGGCRCRLARVDYHPVRVRSCLDLLSRQIVICWSPSLCPHFVPGLDRLVSLSTRHSRPVVSRRLLRPSEPPRPLGVAAPPSLCAPRPAASSWFRFRDQQCPGWPHAMLDSGSAAGYAPSARGSVSRY